MDGYLDIADFPGKCLRRSTPGTESTSANCHDSFPDPTASPVGANNWVVFDVLSARTEFLNVMVYELTGRIIIDLGLIVGEGPFDPLWDGLEEERFEDLPPVIQLEFSAENQRSHL